MRDLTKEERLILEEAKKIKQSLCETEVHETDPFYAWIEKALGAEGEEDIEELRALERWAPDSASRRIVQRFITLLTGSRYGLK